jgi:hypothetical protein
MADEPTVVNVRVAEPPLAVTLTGLVLPNEHVGAGVTTGATLQESVTVPVYPLAGVIDTVDCDEPPGLTVP